MVLLSTLHPSITFFDNAKKIPERVKAHIDKNMGLTLSIKRKGKHG